MTRVAVAFFLCVVLGGGLGPTPAQAIPIAGNYVFVNGDPTLSGTFTSTGSELSAWSFSSNLVGLTTLSWSSDTDVDQIGNQNTAERFITNNAPPEQLFDGYYAQLIWNPDSLSPTAMFRIDATCCDLVFDPVPIVSFLPVQSVPEPETLWLTAIGMVGLAAFVSWRQRGARFS